MKTKTKTKKQLEHEIVELKAQLSSVYAFAPAYIAKLGEDRLMSSGVLVCLYNIGGKEACPPFLIKDGFSKDTIKALYGDLKKSYDLSTLFKPQV